MRHTKRLLGLLLAGLLLLGGCGTRQEAPAIPEQDIEAAPAAAPEREEETAPAPVPQQTEGEGSGPWTPLGEEGTEIMGKQQGFTEFDSRLIAFLEESGYARESFMVSPLSFRAALALAVTGADGETKQSLLRAMGFASVEEMQDWYAAVQASTEYFAAELERAREDIARYPEDYPDGETPDGAFRIANSVWHNADLPGGFGAEYIRAIEGEFGAAARNVPGEQLADAVNDWVNEQTEGMIPRLAEDLAGVDAVLVNALYLRASWIHTFEASDTRPGTFTAVSGEKLQKEFMHLQERLDYYEDENTQLVVLPMKGGIRAAFVLGGTGDILHKLDAAERQEVILTLPKFELETTLGKGELADFMRAMGAGIAFSSPGDAPVHADFSVMSPDAPWAIGDILQKSKLKVDEEGIEAAAVTAIMMEMTAFMPDPPEPKEFTADRPFSFYLYSAAGETPQLLFYGQYVR